MSEKTQSNNLADLFQDVIVELEIKLDVYKNNGPIHAKEGNQEQADLCDRKVKSLEAAITALKANWTPIEKSELPAAPLVRNDLSMEEAGNLITSTASFLCAAGLTGFLSVGSTVTAGLRQHLRMEGQEGHVPVLAVVAVGPQVDDLTQLLEKEPFNLDLNGAQEVTIQPPAPQEEKSGLIV